MSIDKTAAKRAFKEYVQNYNCTDEKIRLKIEHTYRVCELCEEIAVSEGLSGEDVDIAWLSGLLHDIGRFEQLRQYGTFIDSESVDHAALSADVLFNQNEIRNYIHDTRYDTLLKTVIAAHNMYRLPCGLDERTIMFCNILRDADKIDILRVNVEFAPEEIYNVSAEDLRNAEVSPAVMRSFTKETATDRSLKRTSVDHLAAHISLVYELVYDRSIKITAEQGFLDKMIGFKSYNPHTLEQFEEIGNKINNYIQKRLETAGNE